MFAGNIIFCVQSNSLIETIIKIILSPYFHVVAFVGDVYCEERNENCFDT